MAPSSPRCLYPAWCTQRTISAVLCLVTTPTSSSPQYMTPAKRSPATPIMAPNITPSL
ncbi:hypothetical protein DPMN_146656 [Dreissena polymorpha]|uniref:Uncharacterized protein n=1 Tax=Dreissena polymorpha TaxID=45954 RepID=A0A9D4FAQ9_DREPO|nr:hypothetical protein DPMN_146656 [Dreissena polymorpha]